MRTRGAGKSASADAVSPPVTLNLGKLPRLLPESRHQAPDCRRIVGELDRPAAPIAEGDRSELGGLRFEPSSYRRSANFPPASSASQN
jgi:hypothetical protein